MTDDENTKPRGGAFGYPQFKRPEISLEEWEDLLDEPTKEIECTCGSWKTYGKKSNPEVHSDWCDINA